MYNCKYEKYKMKYENKYINEDIETNRIDLFNAIQKLIDPYYFEDLKKYFTLKKIDIMIINLYHYKSLPDSVDFHNSRKIYSLIDDKITQIDISLENITLTQFIFHFLFIIYHFSNNDILWNNFFNRGKFKQAQLVWLWLNGYKGNDNKIMLELFCSNVYLYINIKCFKIELTKIYLYINEKNLKNEIKIENLHINEEN